MTPQERLARVILLCFRNSPALLADSLGISRSTVTRLLKGEIPLTKYYVTRICQLRPRINPAWLLTGEGYEGDIDVENVIARYEKLLTKKDGEIERYQKIIDKLTS